MASGDDKPRGRGTGDEDPPSGKRSQGAGLSKRSDPFDEEPPASKSERSAKRDRSKERDRPTERKRPAERERPKERDRPTERKRPAERERDLETSGDRDAEPEPGRESRSRFSFRRRREEARGDGGRSVASLGSDDPGDDDLGDDDLADLPEPPRFRRPPWWALVGGLVLLLIVSAALYGEFNTERYFLVCSGSKAEAHRGRGFPWPFGHQPLVGSQYRSVSLGGDAQCQTQEVDSEAELRHALLKLVLAEAERLSHKTRSSDLARARRLINQGFLLAKNYKKEKARLEVLRATLDFQQARVVMRELETTLGEARRLFTKAKGQSKEHAKEAAAWIRLLDHMLGRLRRRIAGDPVAPRRVGTAPTPATPGSMIPARPRPAPSASTPTPPTGMTPGPTPPPTRATPNPTPDAGVAGGGILL